MHEHGGFLLSVSPRRGGRPPELDDGETLEWIGRFLARLRQMGARAPFKSRPAVDVPSYGVQSREWLLAEQRLPLEVERGWADVSQQAIDIASGVFPGNRPRHYACTLIAMRAISSGHRPTSPAAGRILSIWMTAAAALRCRIYGCC